MIIYCTLSLIFCFLFSIRYLLAKSYTKKLKYRSINEKDYTVLQPILSGDPRLAEDLRANLQQTIQMPFVWLLDKSDLLAQDITQKILQNVKYAKRVKIILLEDVPADVNPKVYKLQQVIHQISTPYFIVLDDDAVFDRDRLDEMVQYESLTEEFIVTGIPYNFGQSGVWSKLVAAFVNSNAFLTYFPMAKVKRNHTINGMFYISRTALFQKLAVFEIIQYDLCDDLAVAKFLAEHQVHIIQSQISCNVRNTVSHPLKYLLLMKRWMLFTSIYLKAFPSLALYVLVILPSFLPATLLLLSVVLGWRYLLWTLLLFSLKAVFLSRYRNHFFGLSESLLAVYYEVLSDSLLPFIFLYTLVTPRTIQWRNKKIKVIDGKVHYV